MDASGYPKGYGFVRFLDEREQQSALANMQGASGLGAKPIKVSSAIPKGPRADGGGGYRGAAASHHAGLPNGAAFFFFRVPTKQIRLSAPFKYLFVSESPEIKEKRVLRRPSLEEIEFDTCFVL